MEVAIYHNPRCSKSRQTLELLRERGVEPHIIKYLDTPPDVATLRDLAAKLGVNVRDMLRRNETPFRELGLDDANHSEDDILKALSENPVLLQRPIVVAGDQARIGRPPEAVLEILD